MEINDINEFNDNELKKKLEDINNEIDTILKISNDKLNQKIKIVSNELKQKIKERRFKYIENFRIVPIIHIKHDPSQKLELNYIINPILLILANLKVITKFINAEKTNEILKRVNNIEKENIIQYFRDLMIQMRDRYIDNPNYNLIHQYFKNKEKSNAEYLSQDPGYWFRLILYQIEYNIDLVKSNDIENVITNNFVFTLCEIEECGFCKYKNKIPKEKEIIINLTFDSKVEYVEELNNVFNSLYFGDRMKSQSKYCPNCSSNLNISKSFDKTGKYLIINLNQKNNTMKLQFSQNLKIYDNMKEKTYEYKLISALTDININTNCIGNMNKYSLFMKNYINNQCYKIVQGNPDIIKGKINEEINGHNPNILIYKKIMPK